MRRTKAVESTRLLGRSHTYRAIDTARGVSNMSATLDDDGSVMAEERPRPDAPLSTDWENDDPYLGLPADLPSGHSRFPIEPCTGYGDLSFDPFMRQNAAAESKDIVITAEERDAWHSAMRQALGHLIEIPPVTRSSKA